MKKYIPLIIVCLISSVVGYSQNTTHLRMGYLGAQKQVVQGTDTTNYTFGGGGLTSSTHIPQGALYKIAGFAGDVEYFPVVFPDDPFVSKGYYPDYVELRWDVLTSIRDRIRRFHIHRKVLGSTQDSTLVQIVPGDVFNFQDQLIELGVIYEYYIFAEGLADDLRIEYVNIVNGVGFALPTGTTSGQITYQGGNAVEGVSVLAEPDDEVGGQHSGLFNASSYVSIPHEENSNLELSNGFTIQMWTKVIGSGNLFSKGNDYNLNYSGSQVRFTVGGQTVSVPFTHNADTFFHITASYEPNKLLRLYVQERTGPAAVIDSATVAAPASVTPNNNAIQLGQKDNGNLGFSGYLDEVRLWNRSMDSTEIVRDFSRYIIGSEKGLIGYWRFNEGVGNFAYDFSKSNGSFNGNHGEFQGVQWSTEIPLKSQLDYKGITDKDGFYSIAGFPYPASGTRYTFTPVFGVHEFEPNRQARFVTGGNNVFDEVNFTDVSSFPVTGTVYYSGTFFPTEGVEVLIDGNVAIKDGLPVLTDAQGKFEVDVPIGRHTIKVRKFGHTFELDGQFPAITEADSSGVFDFQEPLVGIEFFDKTRIKLAGKVVGGTREGDKLLGFGLTKNNIGNATIVLTTEKGWDLTKKDTVEEYQEKHFFSKATLNELNPTKVTVEADTETGEYVAYLLPEKYIIESVEAGDYVFDGSYTGSVSLQQYFDLEELFEERVYAEIDGEPVPGYEPLDESKYSRTYEQTVRDTVFTVGVDTFTYKVKKDFVLRTAPSIDVINPTGEPFFGDKVYNYADDTREEEVPLVGETGEYLFNYPVFTQGQSYAMKVSVFESYFNANTQDEDRVPVTDGRVDFENAFASTDTKEASLELNSKGEALYTFVGGRPELNTNTLDPSLNYTLPISVASFTGNAQDIRTVWRESNPFRAYVIGSIQGGQNFTTRGPNQIVAILRDPPGSNSYTYLERGTTFTTSSSMNVGNSTSTSAAVTADLGARSVTIAGSYSGTPFAGSLQGQVLENESIFNVTAGVELGFSFSNENENIISYTTTETYSTSGGAPYIGATGDVYLGSGTNILYGAASGFQPLPANSIECLDNNCTEFENQGYRMGKKVSLQVGLDLTTTFAYTQLQIENVVMPELARLRDNLLTYFENPDEIEVIGDKPLYVSLLPPDHENFGTSNFDAEACGNQATSAIGMGPSYKILFPEGYDMAKFQDEIANYNREIAEWEAVLANNEKAKVEATQGGFANLQNENLSLDGGVAYEASFTTSQEETSSTTFTFDINAFAASEIGLEVLGVGTTTSLEISNNTSIEKGSSTTKANEKTWGFVIADEDGDYYTIDVLNAGDGNSPVFKLRAGATSCPHEGVEYSKYFEPGKHTLSDGSAKIESPELTIETPVIAGIPSGSAAEFPLVFKNNSDLAQETSSTFALNIDDATNPNGLVIEMDGVPLGGPGSLISVPSGVGVRKLITVRQTNTSITDYEKVTLVLSSTCDNNLSLAVFRIPCIRI